MLVVARHGRRCAPAGTTVGVLAHEDRRAELVLLLRAHSGVTEGVRFLTSPDLARELRRVPITIEAVGTDSAARLGAEISRGTVNALIFLLGSNPASWLPDPIPLLRACGVAAIPLATNLPTAELLIHQFDADPTSISPPRPFPQPHLSLVRSSGSRDDLSTAG